MTNTHETHFEKDQSGTGMTVTRYFDGSPQDVWDAWTKPEILEQWWAPKPWRAESKSQDFREGGNWMYVMVGPDGTRHCGRVDYTLIKPITEYAGLDAFCDEQGNINPEFPRTKWHNTFAPVSNGTTVTVRMEFASAAAMEQMMAMGFKEGFSMAHTNLDAYLNAGFKLRAEMKHTNKARVCTYLNFPGTTEEAFLFYQKIFNGEFTGKRLQRFGDASLPEGVPPLSDADKKLILHAELTILGGHVLMATDAPESMGFKMEYGMNMHISVEPETRAETERIFNALAEGGTIRMPLMDMFFGSYFGSLKDKYGINWMLNFVQPTSN